MTLLFLLALLLAWPTAGVSIVAYIAFAVLRGYFRAKSRMHYANQRRAERAVSAGEKNAPSWAGDKNKCSDFVELIQKMAMHKGVTREFLQAALLNEEFFQKLIFLAGAMDNEGASFEEQVLAVSEKIVTVWERNIDNIIE